MRFTRCADGATLLLGEVPPARVVVLVLLAMGLAGALAAPAQEVACTDCHEVDLEQIAESVHGFLACADCHVDADSPDHPDVGVEVGCADCHPDAVAEFEASIHGQVRTAASPWQTDCSSCHGIIHALLPRDDPDSTIHPLNLPETCGTCHASPEMAQRLGIRVVLPLEAYSASVHAGAIEAGMEGATCTACHGDHDILPPSEKESSVNRWRVAQTCGHCHESVAAVYRDSIHGRAVQHGITDSPVCTDCHGEHRILGPQDRHSPVNATNVPKLICGRCHGDLRLAEKYGMAADKVPAYEDSYHGLASRAGTTTVAHCGSCHGIHDILPSSNPRAHTHKDNLAQTCGQCHPGAGRVFAIGPVHVLPTAPEHAAVYWIRLLYLWLIGVTIGGMVVHNLLDLYRKYKDPPVRPRPGQTTPRERMSPGFRAAHGMLAMSFIILAYSGFALKYPEAWWARPLLQWESSFALRGWVHRVAAVVMLVAGGLHLVHLAIDPQARACIARMRPTLHDIRELRLRLSYYLGRRPAPPVAAWVDYREKAEYLAVIWGTIVMALTGFLLWAETLVLRWLPGWVPEVATVIHFYEAVLATLAILVWHFYSVFFDPVVYPMDPAWLSGRSAPGRELERQRQGSGESGV